MLKKKGIGMQKSTSVIGQTSMVHRTVQKSSSVPENIEESKKEL